MDVPENEWTATIASALAFAARWLAGLSLLISALAFIVLCFGVNMRPLVTTALSLLFVISAAQVYLIVRIEFDRQIFDRLAKHSADPGPALETFDRATMALCLRRGMPVDKSLHDRAVGLITMVRRMGYILAVQMALAVALHWLSSGTT